MEIRIASTAFASTHSLCAYVHLLRFFTLRYCAIVLASFSHLWQTKLQSLISRNQINKNLF